MELRHLRYFRAVAEHGGIRRAAQQLHVAQPAISRQIRDLEVELGFPLFERIGRQMRLTDAGEAYLRSVRRILDDLVSAESAARAVAEGSDGHLVIGLLETVSWAGSAPRTLARFAARHPGVRLDVRPLSSVDQVAGIAGGTVDGGFGYAQGEPSPPGVASIHLRTDDVVLAVSADRALPEEAPLGREAVRELPMIAFERGAAPRYFDRLEAARASVGLEGAAAILADNETTLLSLVSAGVGCALVNSANTDRPPRNVRFHRVEGLSVPLELHFFHRDPPGDLLRRFLDLLGRAID